MKRLLVVVDMQNDFVTGALGTGEAQAILPQVKEKIVRALEAGDTLVFTQDTHGPDYLSTQEGKNLPVEHCIKDTDGWQLYGKVAALAEGCQKFEKETFGSDSLYKYLKENPYESIELCGLVSNICVVSNAVLAKTAQPQTPVLVDARCTAALDEETNEKTLDVMAGFQVQIMGR